MKKKHLLLLFYISFFFGISQENSIKVHYIFKGGFAEYETFLIANSKNALFGNEIELLLQGSNKI